MEVMLRDRMVNIICLFLTTAHILVIYMLFFMTDLLDTRIGQVGALIVFILGIPFCYRAFKVKSPMRYMLFLTTFFMTMLAGITFCVFLLACF